MRMKKLIAIVLETSTIYFERHISRSAAALSYFLTLSFFPFFICLSWFVGILNLNIQEILMPFEKIVPGDMVEIINRYLQYISSSSSGVLVIAGVILLTTSASGAFRAIMGTMDEVYGRERKHGIFAYLFSRVLALIFLVTVYVSVFVVVTGKWFLDILDRSFGVGGGFMQYWGWLRFIILFFIIFAMLYALYRFLAPHSTGMRPPIFRATLIITVLLVLASTLFSMFISLSSRYSLVYGPLASIIFLMLWMYLCSNVILIGGILNAVLFWRKQNKRFLAFS